MTAEESDASSSSVARIAFAPPGAAKHSLMAPDAVTVDKPRGGGNAPELSTAHAHATAARQRIDALRALMAEVGRRSITTSDAVVLELGCGHGHFLADYAGRHPHRWCWGVDFSRDRIRRAERKQQHARLDNLVFIHAEAAEFLAALPTGVRFQEVFMLFPDPWPKRRHRKNRLLSLSFLARLTPRCAPGCKFYFRSDAMDYVAEVRGLLANHPDWRLEKDEVLPLECESVFQRRAEQFGSAVAALVS